MTLSDNVVLLAQRIGAEFKTVRLEALNTISSKISDATTIGRSLLTATDAASARATLGAGTSSLALGTTATTAAAGNDSRLSDARTPLAHKSTHATGGTDALVASDIGAAASSHTHPSTQISDATTVGKAVLVAADAATARTAIGAGTSSLTIGTTATTAAAGNDARLSDARTPTAHTHPIADLTATGTKDSSTFLRGDGTWSPVAAGTALNGPYAQLRQNAGQSITANTWMALTWQVADLDSHTGWSATVNTNRWTVPAGQGGTYKILGTIVASTIADGSLLGARLMKNGAIVLNTGTIVTTGRTDSLTAWSSATITLAAGDYIELWTYCPVAYTTRYTTADGIGSTLQIERIGAPVATSQKLTAYAEATPGTGYALWADTNYTRMSWSLHANGMATISGLMVYNSGTSLTVCPIPSSLFAPKVTSNGGWSMPLLNGAVNDAPRIFNLDPNLGLVLRGALPAAGNYVSVNGTYPTTSATT